MLAKAERLSAKDIESLGSGKSVFGTLISMRYLPSREARFGVSASKKSFSRAVDRNKVRRKVYRALKAVAEAAPEVYALFVPKRECLDAPESSIEAEIRALFKRSAVR